MGSLVAGLRVLPASVDAGVGGGRISGEVDGLGAHGGAQPSLFEGRYEVASVIDTSAGANEVRLLAKAVATERASISIAISTAIPIRRMGDLLSKYNQGVMPLLISAHLD
jgi:hypothetical protein